jgi:hypothetical protein
MQGKAVFSRGLKKVQVFGKRWRMIEHTAG